MRVFGLIGYPLSHSFSVKYFAEKFNKENITNCVYQNFEIPTIDDFPQIISNNPNLFGLNVTIPYKEKVIPFLDELSLEAKIIGAVNTIQIIRNNGKIKLVGHNTDCYGFHQSLKPLLQANHHKALILGTGGAAKAVEYVLKNLGLEVLYVSRNPENNTELNYADLEGDVFKKFKVIVNSTPLGMYPNINDCPDLPYELIEKDNLLYDLIYNPAETKFMREGAKKGAAVQNGLSMLQLQAEKAWEIWNS
ncbi:MAG: shikimate dehydrogenase [Bacteroidota bacterium]|jgi:shikimate dehydrogenase